MPHMVGRRQADCCLRGCAWVPSALSLWHLPGRARPLHLPHCTREQCALHDVPHAARGQCARADGAGLNLQGREELRSRPAFVLAHAGVLLREAAGGAAAPPPPGALAAVRLRAQRKMAA